MSIKNLIELQKNYVIIFSIISLLWILFFFAILFLSHVAGPDADDYDFLYFVQSIENGTLNFRELFELYYGIHRPVIPRLLLFVEYKFFNGTSIFTTFVGIFFTICSFLLFSKHILDSNINEKSKILLIFFGIILIFGIGQISIINYPSHSLIRTPIIFICLLCAHLFSKCYATKIPPNFFTAICLLIGGGITLLFDFFGIFILIFTLLWLVVSNAKKQLIIIFAIVFVIISLQFLPGNVILNTDAGKLVISEQLQHEISGKLNKNFFFDYFTFLFGYFSSAILPDLSLTSIIIGVCIFIYCIINLKKFIFSEQKEYIFFTSVIVILFMHGLATSAGRYQYGSDYIRFYVFTCWIVWSILFFIMINPTKVRVIACFILILYVITSSIYKIENKASDKNRYTKADINILNGSFHHMAYFRMNLPHIIFDYNPIAHYDTYLKEKKWGMYHDQSYPDISKINRDICVAEKKHSFIVSEKKFYEQILTGWNISRNKYLKNIYAFDQDKRLVAIGKSMPQSDTIVPTRLLSKDKIQIYLIIPMEYPLRNITLLGGDDKNLCLIKLDSSINKSYVE